MRRAGAEWLRVSGLVASLACAIAVSACSITHATYSDTAARQILVARRAAGVRVGLAPALDGGDAGWCITLTSTDVASGQSGASCGSTSTLTGPIITETCSGRGGASIAVLTRRDVAGVTVDGGAEIRTESNSGLPSGLRAAAIELSGYKIQAVRRERGSGPWSPCPLVTPVGANAKPIGNPGKSGIPLAVRLPVRQWDAPAHPPAGVCQLTSSRLPRGTVALDGIVVSRVRPFREFLGRAFVSCAETTYIYRSEHHLPAAVLLDAARPGVAPADLPGMTPLAGHPGVFEAPPDRFARRIRGGWVVVQEEDNIGSTMPVELLEQLRPKVSL